MKIPEKHIQYTYQESKRIFENDLSIKEGAENINKKCDIKVTSATDYGYYFRYLMTGEGSCRSLSKFTQGFYLEKILEEYGVEQMKMSLNHFKKLIEKFEGEKVGSKKAMRAIYEKYSKTI